MTHVDDQTPVDATAQPHQPRHDQHEHDRHQAGPASGPGASAPSHSHLRALIRIVMCGSVDDGKSTLLGRLLAETNSLPEDQIEAARYTRRPGSTIPVGEVDYSLVTDGLEAERTQGITIDVAYRHLLLPSGRRAVLADAPGHEQYTRNMAVAASTADIAVLLVDAVRGTRPQTHRHLTVCGLMGVKHVIVAVNKMDGVDYDQAVFDRLVAEVTETAHRLEIPEVSAVPVSALEGVNVTTVSSKTPWYSGGSLLNTIDDTVIADDPAAKVRLPVQTIVRGESFRGYGGLLASGTISPGDELTVVSSGERAAVRRLVYLAGEVEVDLPIARAGASVCVELDRDVDVTRGDLLASGEELPSSGDRFMADLVWVGEQQLAHGRSYLLRCGPMEVPATVTAIRYRLQVTNGEHLAARVLEMNDVGRVEIATDRPVPLEDYQRHRATGGFILIDRVSGETLAAGLTRYALRRSSNVIPHQFEIDRTARERLNAHPSRVVWFTGLPGSGKSTVADAVERRLHALGVRAYVLDGDSVRTGLTKDLGFTPEDRAENVRRVAEVAKLMMDAGLVVLVSLVSPFRADRRAARELFADGDFAEVFVDTPLEVCAARDPKGLYAKAAAGQLPNMTGPGQDYERPERPDLRLDGTADVESSVEQVLALIEGQDA